MVEYRTDDQMVFGLEKLVACLLGRLNGWIKKGEGLGMKGASLWVLGGGCKFSDNLVWFGTSVILASGMFIYLRSPVLQLVSVSWMLLRPALAFFITFIHLC
jgi:hypothetical protein